MNMFAELASHLRAEANHMDGIRVSFPDEWALARASNTQPVLVLRFEANSPGSLKTIRTRFEDVIRPLL
jgi:phosphomannomutase/phosphoglucomutase